MLGENGMIDVRKMRSMRLKPPFGDSGPQRKKADPKLLVGWTYVILKIPMTRNKSLRSDGARITIDEELFSIYQYCSNYR